MRTFWYALASNPDERHDVLCNAPSLRGHESLVGEAAADDYWDFHDGNEAQWPLDFLLFESLHGDVKATVTVDAVVKATFRATTIYRQPRTKTP